MVNEQQPGAEAANAAASARHTGAAEHPAGRAAAAGPAGGAALTERTRRDLTFTALRNALYHGARERFLDTAHRAFQFLAIFGGAGVVSTLGHDFPVIGTVSAIAMAVATAIDMSWDPRGLALESARLRRRYYELLADAGDADAAGLARLQADLKRLYAEERPQLRAVDATAWNSAAASLYDTKVSPIPLTRAEKWLAHLWAFNDVDFSNRSPAGGADAASGDSPAG